MLAPRLRRNEDPDQLEICATGVQLPSLDSSVSRVPWSPPRIFGGGNRYNWSLKAEPGPHWVLREAFGSCIEHQNQSLSEGRAELIVTGSSHLRFPFSGQMA